ncbi:MAG: hypothetical protein GY931_11850, partial [Maribacter sp.]|nr:hypothetical protein [Maribacter sp.]
KYNLAKNATDTQLACERSQLTSIKLRDTESYITEIVGGLVTKLNMPLGDFVEVVNNISDPAWQ